MGEKGEMLREMLSQRGWKKSWSGEGASILVYVGTNNAEREGTTAIVRKYRQLVRTCKQVIMSGILPVKGSMGQGYQNC